MIFKEKKYYLNLRPLNKFRFLFFFSSVPRVQFKEAAYSVTEPKAVNEINTLIIQVIRTGDISQTSSVRCTPHDASAVSGLDYNAKSVILLFEPGIISIFFQSYPTRRTNKISLNEKHSNRKKKNKIIWLLHTGKYLTLRLSKLTFKYTHTK